MASEVHSLPLTGSPHARVHTDAADLLPVD